MALVEALTAIELKCAFPRCEPSLRNWTIQSVHNATIEPYDSDRPELLACIRRTISVTQSGGPFQMMQLKRNALRLLNHGGGRGGFTKVIDD